MCNKLIAFGLTEYSKIDFQPVVKYQLYIEVKPGKQILIPINSDAYAQLCGQFSGQILRQEIAESVRVRVVKNFINQNGCN